MSSKKNIDLKNLKIAIVHDWLPLIGGAERVLEQMVNVFPQADIYTLFDFLTDDQKKIFGSCKIYTSYLNKLPFVHKYYRHLLSFCPQAIESFDLSEYDLVISSSASIAKGVLTRSDQRHLSYVHSPARYAWDLMHSYLKESKLDRGLKGYIAQNMLHKFRIWDLRTVNGVDKFIANSHYIRQRINRIYRREADVIYPPIDVTGFTYHEQKQDYYFTASRLVPYKRIDLIVSSFAKMPDKKLVIIGAGPDADKVKAIADKYDNIEYMGYQPFSVMREKMQNAKAFVFAAEEDFGIIPVEAQACGTPVIAFGKGGALETVIGYDVNDHTKNATGVFFDQQTEDSICHAVNEFETIQGDIHPQNCRKHAETFSTQIFQNNLANAVQEIMA